jgi:phosphatidate cytidylyltransferase
MVFFFVLIPIIELYQKSERPFENIALLILPIIYISVPFALMNITYSGQGAKIVLAFFIFVWASDVGAYCFGMLLGKHKLFPRISPQKSWEGFFGGIITAIVVSILVSHFMFDGKNLQHWLIVSVITSVFGTLGDLVESMLKRSVGIKDSGKIMPGHGGMLDRFDAVLLAFPVVFVYMIIVF